MTSDQVIHELRTITVPGTAEARDRVLVAARSVYRHRPTVDSPPRLGYRRIGIAVASIAVVVAVSLTPAGQAATGWVTELVGLGHIPKNHPPRGHVGGRPSDPTSVGLTKPYPQIVVAKGTTPTGQPYEVSVYRSPQGKYGTCFTLWSPRVGQPNAQGTSQCAWRRGVPTIGPFCVANSSGCGDSHHSFKDRIWFTPSIAVVSPDVARLSVHSTRPADEIRGVRIVSLGHKFQHQVGAPQAANVALFFVEHPARSPVRFEVTAYNENGRVLGRTVDGAAAAGGWRPQHIRGDRG
jgi:hypothetical protein